MANHTRLQEEVAITSAGEDENTLRFAREMDRKDPLRKFRGKFHHPFEKGKRLLYFTGNSLGLQPKSVRKYVDEELDDWASMGVEGHVDARRPWMYYHRLSKKSLASLVGAKESEVVAMNQLTVNLHLMLVSFYRPTATRYKIVVEVGAFPSDQYALESQVRFHGMAPEDVLVEVHPRNGRHLLDMDDILSTIRDHGDSVALVMFGGIQYYTGQFFNLKRIVEAGHAVGAVVGFDLAHAIGNVPLNLHDDDADFAVWCSYKYLNSGPGAVAGAFVHERHARAFTLPRFAGWWGHNEKERFQMKKGFKPMEGVDGWQVSNYSVIHSAAHLASLEIFDQAGFNNLRKKSVALTGYAERLINRIDPSHRKVEIITPVDPDQRGCQLSLFFSQDGRAVFDYLRSRGVVADWREPNVIRIAPVPLYNSFEDIYRFNRILQDALNENT